MVSVYTKISCSKLPHFIEKHDDIILKGGNRKEHDSISTVFLIETGLPLERTSY